MPIVVCMKMIILPITYFCFLLSLAHFFVSCSISLPGRCPLYYPSVSCLFLSPWCFVTNSLKTRSLVVMIPWMVWTIMSILLSSPFYDLLSLLMFHYQFINPWINCVNNGMIHISCFTTSEYTCMLLMWNRQASTSSHQIIPVPLFCPPKLEKEEKAKHIRSR